MWYKFPWYEINNIISILISFIKKWFFWPYHDIVTFTDHVSIMSFLWLTTLIISKWYPRKEIIATRYVRDIYLYYNHTRHASRSHVKGKLPTLRRSLLFTSRRRKRIHAKIQEETLSWSDSSWSDSDSPGNSSSCTGRGSSHDFRALFPLCWPRGLLRRVDFLLHLRPYIYIYIYIDRICMYISPRTPMLTSAIVSVARRGLRDDSTKRI